MEPTMQTRHIQRYTTPKFLTALLAVSVLANAALGIATLASSGYLPFSGDSETHAVVAGPKAIDPATAARLELDMLRGELYAPYNIGATSGIRQIDPATAARLELEMLRNEMFMPGGPANPTN
jgi:hypothetical protein